MPFRPFVAFKNTKIQTKTSTYLLTFHTHHINITHQHLKQFQIMRATGQKNLMYFKFTLYKYIFILFHHVTKKFLLQHELTNKFLSISEDGTYCSHDTFLCTYLIFFLENMSRLLSIEVNETRGPPKFIHNTNIPAPKSVANTGTSGSYYYNVLVTAYLKFDNVIHLFDFVCISFHYIFHWLMFTIAKQIW